MRYIDTLSKIKHNTKNKIIRIKELVSTIIYSVSERNEIKDVNSSSTSIQCVLIHIIFNFDSHTDNYWTDFYGEGEYQIDGKHNSTDPYPFVYNSDCCTDVSTEESGIIMVTIIVSFLGIAIVGKRIIFFES